MRKIAILSSEFKGQPSIGGIGTYNWYLSRGLAEEGAQLDLLTLSNVSKVEKLSENLRVHHVPIDNRFSEQTTELIPYSGYTIIRSLSLWHYFIENLEISSFDALDVQEHLGLGFMNAYSSVLPMLVRLQTPVFFHEFHDLSERAFVPSTFDIALLRQIESLPILKANLLVGSSNIFAGKITSAVGLSKATEILRNPIDLADFKAKNSYEIKDRNFKWTFVGRLEKRKGVHTLIDAMAEALRKEPAMKLEIVGPDTGHGSVNGSTRQELEKRVAELGISEQIEFKNEIPLESLGDLLFETDGVVVPSEFDNAPYTCVSAMAAGLPVIGTDSGGMAEYIGDNQRGLVVPVNDSKKLAESMVQVANDRALRESLGRSARTYVEENCDYREIARQSLALYDDPSMQNKSPYVTARDCKIHLDEVSRLLDQFYSAAEKRTTYDTAYQTGLNDGIAHATRKTVLTRAAQKISTILSDRDA